MFVDKTLERKGKCKLWSHTRFHSRKCNCLYLAIKLALNTYLQIIGIVNGFRGLVRCVTLSRMKILRGG